MDPDQEIRKYWEKEDFLDPYIEPAPQPTGAAMTADSAAAIAANAAACYTEELEKPLLTVEEKVNPAARFRIVSKIKGQCMRDTDED